MMLEPCEVWDLDDTCADIPDDTDYAIIDRWQAVSSKLLWVASGRRYGTCEVTVRPCLRSCASGGLSTPYRDGSGWHNFCGCVRDCSCTSLCEIVLEGPVAEVTQVLIDGDELVADSYRVDLVGGRSELLRTDGGCWPSCQDMQADCGDEGAFCVTYLKGIALDDLAIAANTELTSQLVQACLGCKGCKLPANVQSVVRRGIAITFTQPQLEWMRSLRMVAAFLDTVNPQGLSSDARVWSPDLTRWRQTVAPEVS